MRKTLLALLFLILNDCKAWGNKDGMKRTQLDKLDQYRFDALSKSPATALAATDFGEEIFDPDTFQNQLRLPRPIFRVFLKNMNRKYFSLRDIEAKLEGLVANEG